MSFYAWNFACSPAVGYNDPLSVENLAMARLLLGNMSIRDSGILYWTDASYVAQVGSLSNPFDGLFEPTDVGGGIVQIASGAAIVNGYLFISDDTENFDINSSPGNANATDRIVLRWTAATQDVSLTRVNGAAGNTAVLTQTSSVWDTPIARVELDGSGDFLALIDDRRLAMPTGTVVKLGEQDGDATFDTFTFSNIHALFSELRVVINARSTFAAGTDGITMILNGDAGANYSWQRWQTVGLGSPADDTGFAADGDNSFSLGDVANANAPAPANFLDTFDIHIFNQRYTDRYKTIHGRSQYIADGNNTDYSQSLIAGWYASLDPITEIDVILTNGDFTAISSVHLYGII